MNPQRWQERQPWTVITAISSGSRRMSATTVDQVPSISLYKHDNACTGNVSGCVLKPSDLPT